MPTTEVTDPMLLDSTGQDIVTKLQNIADAILPPTAAGVGYDNTESGLMATDLQGAVDELLGMIPSLGLIAPVEATAEAGDSYAADDYLILDGVLYIVTVPITAGDTIEAGVNVTATTVMAEIVRLTGGGA